MTQDELFVLSMLALKGQLPELVLVGAWANRLYQFHPLAKHSQAASPRLMTVDVDLAIASSGVSGSLKKVMEHAGFRESVRGEAKPPATKYHPPGVEDDNGFYLEFVSPLTGGPVQRGGRTKQTTCISGIVAWQLRDIDVLLRAPWELELTAAHGLPLDDTSIPIRVAAPERYLLQKVLSIPRRSTPNKMGKDLLYLHDAFITFGTELEGLAEPFALVASEYLKDKRRRRMLISFESMQRDDRLLAEARRIGLDAGRPATEMNNITAVLREGIKLLLR